MNRQIKFRAWDKEHNEFATSSTFRLQSIPYGFDNHGVIHLNNSLFDYQQFTGLTDKNGTELYDGDLLLVDDHRTVKVIWHEPTASFDTEYISDTKHSIKDRFRGIKNNEWKWRTVKIGNIHEHKELLK